MSDNVDIVSVTLFHVPFAYSRLRLMTENKGFVHVENEFLIYTLPSESLCIGTCNCTE